MDEFHKYLSKLFDDIKPVDDISCEQFCKGNDFNSQICNYEELDQIISVQEVEYTINKLNREKAMGKDCLLNEFCIDIISHHLADIFNAIVMSVFFLNSGRRELLSRYIKRMTHAT